MKKSLTDYFFNLLFNINNVLRNVNIGQVNPGSRFVQGINSDKNALGYFGFAYYVENQKKLKAVAIDGGKGPVMPSSASVENGTYQPLSRPIFIYVNAASLAKPEIRDFVNFYMQHADKLVREVKYVPLPATVYRGNLEHMAKKKLGTVFGGESEVGVRIEDLMKREARF